MRLLPTPRVLRRRLAGESGSMMIELLLSMTFIAVAVGALLSIYTASVFSLRHSSIEGNALTLVDKQMEVFRTLPFDQLKLNGTTIPASSDAYVTAPPSSLTSSQRSGISSSQATGGTYAAVQLVTGPDQRQYRVDTYIYGATPADGRAVVQVTVGARLVTNGVAGPVRADISSAFDQAATIPPPE